MFDTGYKIILYPLFKLCEKDKTMLQLKNITKDYKVGNEKVHALRGVSIDFRESEFVSILGQSGCGKTTLLNIIGGHLIGLLFQLVAKTDLNKRFLCSLSSFGF